MFVVLKHIFGLCLVHCCILHPCSLCTALGCISAITIEIAVCDWLKQFVYHFLSILQAAAAPVGPADRQTGRKQKKRKQKDSQAALGRQEPQEEEQRSLKEIRAAEQHELHAADYQAPQQGKWIYIRCM